MTNAWATKLGSPRGKLAYSIEQSCLLGQKIGKGITLPIHKRLLGSKTLGTKCIKTSMCNVLANHDQKLEPRFRLLKVCLFVKLESSELQDVLAKFAGSIDWKLGSIDRTLCKLIFCKSFSTQLKPDL